MWCCCIISFIWVIFMYIVGIEDDDYDDDDEKDFKLMLFLLFVLKGIKLGDGKSEKFLY